MIFGWTIVNTKLSGGVSGLLERTAPNREEVIRCLLTENQRFE